MVEDVVEEWKTNQRVIGIGAKSVSLCTTRTTTTKTASMVLLANSLI